VRPALALLLLSSLARADHWPLEHYVLSKQRVMPCEELEVNGDKPGERTRYVMKLDKAGRVLLRDEPAGKNEVHVWQRYGYDKRGRIALIEGVDNFGEDRFKAVIRYDAEGRLLSIESRSVHTPDDSMNELVDDITRNVGPIEGLKRTRPKPKPEEHLFKSAWSYEKDGLVRTHSEYDGKEMEGVEHWVNGRVETAGSEPEIETASYDDKGQLVSMQLTIRGKKDFIRRYYYDDKKRLVREEIVKPDGKVDQTREYRYECGARPRAR
jgi:hypothetical protein